MDTQDSPQLQQRRIKVGAARIAYGVAGNGPLVLLTHDLSGSIRWCRYIIER
jgi:hypothetical protein